MEIPTYIHISIYIHIYIYVCVYIDGVNTPDLHHSIARSRSLSLSLSIYIYTSASSRGGALGLTMAALPKR